MARSRLGAFALGLRRPFRTLPPGFHAEKTSRNDVPRASHRIMASSDQELETLLKSYQRLRRTVRWHLIFFLFCIVAALLLRRALNYPPMLSWIVFAVPAIVFGADFIRLFACRWKLARYRSRLEE